MTELVPYSPAAVDTAAFFNAEQIDLIKRTLAPKATADEFKLFLYQCARTGLDPLSKQIYPISRWDSQLRAEKMTIQTGIDGLRLIAERTGRYAPGPEAQYEYDGDKLLKATAFVKKMTKDGVWHVVAASAFFEEYAQTNKEKQLTNMWATKPHIMLSKCAEALALRKAFPAEMSGLYTSDEMGKADDAPSYTPPEAAKGSSPKASPTSTTSATMTTTASPDGVAATPSADREPGSDDDEEEIPEVDPLELAGLMLNKKPKGLGWVKSHAMNWLKKHFGSRIEGPADLDKRQRADAKALLTLRIQSEEAYLTRLEQMAIEGRVLGEGEVAA
jgi:phage recombination protein Bet